jgi:threonine dehydrogenase-like Zn-dependent dehydrogenase
MKCDAIWVTDFKKIEIRSLDVQKPKYNEILVQTKACGVCCWDAYQFQGQSGPGPYPYVIGHEGVGIVAEVGEGIRSIRPGDKVACASGSIIEMAQYFTITEDCVAKLPDDTEDYAQWVIEPACTVQNVLNWAHIVAGEHLVLIGAGYMGMLTLMGLQAYPWGELTVFEKREDRLELAKQYYPTRAYNPDSPQGQEYIEALVAQGGADNVIEFSASDSGFALAVQIARREQARMTIGSWHRHAMTFDGTRFHMGGFDVHNVSPMTTFHYTDVLPQTAALIRRGIYKPGELVTHVADYHDCQHVFERAVDKEDGYMKGVITF